MSVGRKGTGWGARLRLQAQMSVLLGIALLTMVLQGMFAIVQMRSTAAEMQRWHENDLRAVLIVSDAELGLARLGAHLRELAHTEDPETVQVLLSTTVEVRTHLGEDLDQLRALLQDAEVKELFQEFEGEYRAYFRAVDEGLALLRSNPGSGLSPFLDRADVRLSVDGATGKLQSIARRIEHRAQASSVASQQTAASSTRHIVWVVLAAAFLLVLAVLLAARSMREPLAALIAHLQALTRGESVSGVPYVRYASEVGELARAIATVQEEVRETEGQRWMSTHLAELARVLQLAENQAALASTFLHWVAPLLQAGHGLFYSWCDADQELRVVQGYAVSGGDGRATCKLGEGLVGQAALERRPLVLEHVPEGYLRMRGGLSDVRVQALILLPMHLKGRLLGVVELACWVPLSTIGRELIDRAMPLVAMALEIAEKSARTQELLEATRRQTQVLEAQRHEMEAAEAWNRSIIDAAPDGLLVVDDTGTIIMANRRLEAMCGYEPGELIGRPIEVLVPERLRGGHVAMRDGYLFDSQAQPRRFAETGARELRALRKDGSEFAAEIGLARLPHMAGRNACVCASLRNISIHE